MIEEYGKNAVILSFGFLATILFFAFELPYLQHILSLGLLLTIVTFLSIVLTRYISWQASKLEDVRGQIIYLGMSFILIFMLLLGISSFVNRKFSSATDTKIRVDSIQAEYSSMFGVLKSEGKDIGPTHLRISFEHEGENYSRAFRSRKVHLEKDMDEDIYIHLAKGALNFTFVR